MRHFSEERCAKAIVTGDIKCLKKLYGKDTLFSKWLTE